MIDPTCKIKSVIERAFNDAAFVCADFYGSAPEINITGTDRYSQQKFSWAFKILDISSAPLYFKNYCLFSFYGGNIFSIILNYQAKMQPNI